MDKEKVTIVRTFRNAVAKQDYQEYRKNLKTQIRQDFADAIAEQRLTKDFFSYDFALGKIVKFVLGRSKTSFWDVMDVIKNSSKGMLRSTIKLLEDAVSKVKSGAKRILQQLNLVKSVIKIKDIIKNLGHYSKSYINKILQKFIQF